MICKKCGSRIQDGFEFCPYCGTAVVQEKKQENEREEDMTIMFSQEAPFSHMIQVPNKLKKNGKGLAVVTILATVLAVIVIACALCFSSISSILRRTFASPETYYTYVELKEMKENGDKWAKMYDNLLEAMNVAKTGSKNELSVEMSKNMQDTLAMLMGMDFSWLSKVSLQLGAYNANNMMGGDAQLGLNSQTLLGVNLTADMNANKIYLSIPELSDAYVGVSLEDLESVMSDSYYGSEVAMSDIMSLFKDSGDITKYIADGKTIKNMVERYSNILFADATDIIKTKETLEVDGISKECIVLTTTLTVEDMLNRLHRILEEIKNDQDIKRIVETLIADMKKMDTAGNFVEEISYEMFVEEIVSLQEELAEVLESEETEDTLTHVVYVGKADKIVGREFIAKEDGKEVFKISFKRVENKKDFATEISFTDGEQAISVDGKGTVEDSKENSTYTVSMNDMSLLKITVKDYDVKAAEEGYTKGTFVLSVEPGVGQLDGVTEQILLVINAYQLKVSCDTSKSSSDVTVSLVANGADMISFGLKQSYGNSDSGKLPKESDKVYNLLNEEDVWTYMDTLNWDVLKNKIDGLGMPEELKSMVDYYLAMMGIY